MNKYIDAEKLKAEIERRKKIEGWCAVGSDTADVYYARGFRFACDFVLNTINSLQQEQPELPGIKDHGIPGKDFIPVEWADACEMYGKRKIVKQEKPEVDLKEEIDKFLNETGAPYVWCNDDEQKEWCNIIARHFYELGLNARKEESK